MPFLVPATPTGSIRLTMDVPNTLVPHFVGALMELGYDHNWEYDEEMTLEENMVQVEIGLASITEGGIPVSEALLNALVKRTSSQTVNTNVHDNVDWNGSDYDPGGWFSQGLNPDRVTVPTYGIYLITASVIWEVKTSGGRYLTVNINGQDYYGLSSLNQFYDTRQSGAITLFLSPGDWIALDLYYNGSGSTLLTGARMGVTRLIEIEVQ